MIGIYKITSPSNKVYIGKSVNVRVRFNVYNALSKNSIGRSLFNSLKKYTPSAHSFEIIHHLPDDIDDGILSTYEQLYINLYKSCGVDMMNLTDGGDGSIGYKHTEQSKSVMKLKATGRMAGDKNINYGKGRFGADNGIYGTKRPRKIIDKLIEVNQKKVVQYTLSGDYITEYESVTKAAKAINAAISMVSNCCLGRAQIAKGFVFRFYGDKFKKPVNKTLVSVMQFTKDGVFIAKYDSIREAMDSLNIGKKDSSHISACCRSKKMFGYGYKWEYENKVA